MCSWQLAVLHRASSARADVMPTAAWAFDQLSDGVSSPWMYERRRSVYVYVSDEAFHEVGTEGVGGIFPDNTLVR